MVSLIIKSADQLLDKSTIFECLPSHRGLALHRFFFFEYVKWPGQGNQKCYVYYDYNCLKTDKQFCEKLRTKTVLEKK